MIPNIINDDHLCFLADNTTAIEIISPNTKAILELLINRIVIKANKVVREVRNNDFILREYANNTITSANEINISTKLF